MPQNFISEETIRNNRIAVMEMSPVAYMDGTEFERGEKPLSEQVNDYYNTFKNRVINPEIGTVYFDKVSTGSDIAHGLVRLKAVSFSAVPAVTRLGKVVNVRYNWKGREYDTVVLCAPVDILGKHFLMAEVINKTDNSDRLYVHEVVAIEKEGDSLLTFKAGALTNKDNPDSESPTLLSILQEIIKSNHQNESNLRKQRRDGSTSSSEGNDAATRFNFSLVDTADADTERVERDHKGLQETLQTLSASFKGIRGFHTSQSVIDKLARQIVTHRELTRVFARSRAE